MNWWPWLHPRLIGVPHGPSPSMLGRRNALFNRPAAPLRSLVVMVDADLLNRAKGDEKVKYLLELLAEKPIQAHLFAAEGPPAHAQRVTAAETGVEGVKDWVITRVHGDGEGLDAIYLKDGIPTHAQTQVKDPVFAYFAETLPPGRELTSDGIVQLRADALALLIAKAIRADLFVTDRHMLVDPKNGFWWTTTVMRPEVALPIVGLYLRQQGKYALARSPALGSPATKPGISELDRITFYWQAAQDLLPIARTWDAACGEYSRTTGDDTLAPLPKALTWRIDQVLRSRDRLLSTLAVVPQDHNTADEALSELDQILLWLMAAFDITAQVADIALGVREKFPGWQNEDWLKKVRAKDQALADLLRNETEAYHVLTILKELRNTIHGEALSAGGVIPVVGDRAMEILVRLPRSREVKVFTAMGKLDDLAAWGVGRPFPDANLHLHAGTFVERLLPLSLKALGQLMASTPVERLPGLNAKPGQYSGIRPRSLFDRRVQWQLGL